MYMCVFVCTHVHILAVVNSAAVKLGECKCRFKVLTSILFNKCLEMIVQSPVGLAVCVVVETRSSIVESLSL